METSGGHPRDARAGIALMLGGSASTQAGAAVGALAFPAMGPVGVVTIRQLVLAAVLVPLVRPRIWRLSRAQWWPIVGMALVLCVMNLSVYAAIERIGLGLAITLEFLGPLGVALAGARRKTTRACAALAALGVVVLMRPGGSTDLLGVGLALLAAVAWAAYILLGRTLGRRLTGLEGTASASLVTTLVWLPVAIVWFTAHPQQPLPIILAIICGILSSVVPYVADVHALRRVPAATYGAFTSANPVWAALIGWLVLGQALGGWEWLGIGLIVLSNVGVAWTQAPRRPGRERVGDAGAGVV